MAFVNTISFSHRFSTEEADFGPAYEEINMTISNDNARALCEGFFRFAMAAGYMPVTILNAFAQMEEEYGFLRQGDGTMGKADQE
jgi:hypothetical protein